MFGPSGTTLEGVAHIIQMALTPVFLLSGVAALLNVFSNRLGRVADQVDLAAAAAEQAGQAEALRLSARLSYLRRRSLSLDIAVVLGAVAGAASCAAILTLFVGALSDRTVATVLFGFFGGAVLCTLGSLVAFAYEMLLASRGLRDAVSRGTSDAEAQSAKARLAGASAALSG